MIEIEKYYRNKKVLVTGHTGFKGSWLSIWLKKMGAIVMGYSLDPPSRPNNFEASELSGRLKHTHGDIRNLAFFEKSVSDFQPEYVFHLAAQPLVRFSYDDPILTFETNVMGTVHVCEIVRNLVSVKSFINVTTDKCYENREWLWGYRENDRLGGHDPYSSSKACAELVSQAYIRSFFKKRENLGVASVRAGNVIGGGDWGIDRLFPDCIRSLSEDKNISIRNPRAIRPWQFVLEPLYGYLLLATRLRDDPSYFSGAWNFGPAETSCVSVGDVADKVLSAWGDGHWTTSDTEQKTVKHEMSVLKLNSEKAFSQLGWQGILSIDEAIEMTVKWYKRYYMKIGEQMYDSCEMQIHEYENKMRAG